MEDTRKGFLLPEQEKLLDELIELKGIAEALDGTAIKIADNTGLQKLKEKIFAEKPEMLEMIYMVIDELFLALKGLNVPIVNAKDLEA